MQLVVCDALGLKAAEQFQPRPLAQGQASAHDSVPGARLGLLPHARHADHAHVDTYRVRVILSGGDVLVRPDLDRIGLQLDRREYP